MPLNQSRMGGFTRQPPQRLPRPQGLSIGPPAGQPDLQAKPPITAPPVANNFEFKQPPYDQAGGSTNGSIDKALPHFLGPPIVNPDKMQASSIVDKMPAPPIVDQLPNQPMFDPALIRTPQLNYRQDLGGIEPPYDQRGGFTGGIMPPIMDNRVEQAPLSPEGLPPVDNRNNQAEEMRRRFGGRNRFSGQ